MFGMINGQGRLITPRALMALMAEVFSGPLPDQEVAGQAFLAAYQRDRRESQRRQPTIQNCSSAQGDRLRE